MDAAVGVFHHLKQSLLKGEELELASVSGEYPSQYSEDYNETGVKVGLKEKLPRLSLSCDHLPVKETYERAVAGDSGFNSEQNSSVVYSDCLENYGLDGPIPDCASHDSQEPSQISEDKHSDFQPLPSVTSSTTRKRREKEVKQATIRQHYYPEGGWGYIVLLCASLVNILAHGLQLSFGVLLLAILRRWGSHVTLISASEYHIVSCLELSVSVFRNHCFGNGCPLVKVLHTLAKSKRLLQVLLERFQCRYLFSCPPLLWPSARGSPLGSRP